MGIEMVSCPKCGGRGKLADFDHCYNPKNSSIKFLKTKKTLKTWGECKNCERTTEGFFIPAEAIMAWNKGEIYSSEEYREKLAREYTGKVYTEDEIKEYIINTNFNKEYIDVDFTNGTGTQIHFNPEYSKYEAYWFGCLSETNIKVFIISFLNEIQNKKLKVKSIERVLIISI